MNNVKIDAIKLKMAFQAASESAYELDSTIYILNFNLLRGATQKLAN